ncbi:MAG: hypothetical protein KKD74_11185 [Bacteroidetes bacterium]|nr:hypothetical protein [Bacteroidales bacterium]MBU1010690.1 hypothetical protein [Bacteroidota bacterium]
MKHAEDDRFIRFNNQLKEGEDYYMENGYRVMKSEFLIRRGYCCGNGCRHCPYMPRHLKGNRTRTD